MLRAPRAVARPPLPDHLLYTPWAVDLEGHKRHWGVLRSYDHG